MSAAQRNAILDVIGKQQAALDCAIERGNIGLQLYIWQHMVVLETALAGDSHELAV